MTQDWYFWLLGRIDDVMNVAGHRLSTFETESALVDDSKVAEAAVVSRPDDLKGEGIVAFVTLYGLRREDAAMLAELREHVAKGDRTDREARQHHLHAGPPEDPVGEDHAPAATRRRPRQRPLDVTTLANAEIVEQIHDMVETARPKHEWNVRARRGPGGVR